MRLESDIGSLSLSLSAADDDAEYLHLPEDDSFIYHDVKPSYGQYFSTYLNGNKPCIFSCGIIDHWNLCSSWLNGQSLNAEYLRHKYGHLEVPVYNCSERYFDSQCKVSLTLKKYLTYFTLHSAEKALYLKDWHLQRQHQHHYPEESPFYSTPEFFCSDWLNEFCHDQLCGDDEDYRFVYLGGRNTWTPLHADVFRSFSWSANVLGRKRWVLLPPDEELKLRSCSADQLPWDLTERLQLPATSDVAADRGRQTDLHTSADGVRYYDVIQERGDVMYVPSDWFHQVWNLEPTTLSVNHNWLNAANVHRTLRHLLDSLRQVQRELEHIHDDSHWWESQCQTVLKALNGMHVAEFVALLRFTVRRRVASLRDGRSCPALDGRRYDLGHVTADLRQLLSALRTMADSQLLADITCLQGSVAEVEELAREVDNVLETHAET